MRRGKRAKERAMESKERLTDPMLIVKFGFL